MRTHKILIALALTSGLVGCAAQSTQRPSQLALSDCASLSPNETVAALYSPGKVRSVEPTYKQQFLARAIQPRFVSGAALYVPAEPGMTSAYLQRALNCHAASTASIHPNDPLRVAGVTTVTVSEAGPTMRISIQGEDRAAGKAIWERSQMLREQQAEVTVEQLSAAPAQPRF
jgi:hypothetical protein